MDKRKKEFLEAVAKAMDACNIPNVLLIYNIDGDLHNSTLATDPNAQASRFMDAISDQLGDVFETMHNAGANG